MLITHVGFPAKGVLTLRYCLRYGALIEKAWQQTENNLDWEPCDPKLVHAIGMKNGIVRVFNE